MKTQTTLSLLALLAAAPWTALQAAAQTLSDDIPDCALQCTQTAASNVGCKSDLSDRACLCGHISGFVTSAFLCASTNGSCNQGDFGSLNGALSSVCSGVSPSPTSGSSTGGAGSGPGSASTKSTATVIVTSGSPSSPSTGSAHPTTETGTVHTTATPATTASPAASTVQPTITTVTANAPTIPSPASPTLTPLGVNTAASDTASSTVVLVQTVVLPQTSGNAALGMRAGILGGMSAGPVVAVVGAMLMGALVL